MRHKICTYVHIRTEYYLGKKNVLESIIVPCTLNPWGRGQAEEWTGKLKLGTRKSLTHARCQETIPGRGKSLLEASVWAWLGMQGMGTGLVALPPKIGIT